MIHAADLMTDMKIDATSAGTVTEGPTMQQMCHRRALGVGPEQMETTDAVVMIGNAIPQNSETVMELRPIVKKMSLSAGVMAMGEVGRATEGMGLIKEVTTESLEMTEIVIEKKANMRAVATMTMTTVPAVGIMAGKVTNLRIIVEGTNRMTDITVEKEATRTSTTIGRFGMVTVKGALMTGITTDLRIMEMATTEDNKTGSREMSLTAKRNTSVVTTVSEEATRKRITVTVKRAMVGSI